MNDSRAPVVWRVRTEDNEDSAMMFDCSVVYHSVSDPQSLPIGESLRSPFRGYYNRSVPFEEQLVDEPFTLVLRARAGTSPLVVEFESSHSKGSASTRGGADGSLVVIVHTERGDAYAGLPNGPEADHDFDWSSVATS